MLEVATDQRLTQLLAWWSSWQGSVQRLFIEVDIAISIAEN